MQAEVKRRKIGNTQLEVAPLAFGGNVFGWTIDEPTSFELLDGFVDAGLNLVDTADVYSAWKEGNVGGESETIIGKWFKRSGKRNKVVLATKCGFDGSTDKKNLSAAHIHKAVDASLKRLQTDHVDLLHIHKLEDDDEVKSAGEKGGSVETYYSLREQKVALPAGLNRHVDMVGSGSDEHIQLWLRYYADEEDRRSWAREWPSDPIPARAKPPFDRDRFLPRPPRRSR